MHTDDLFDTQYNYFATPSLKGLVQQLHHLAFFGDGISLVQGASGSGKTSLISVLHEQFTDANEFCVVTMEGESELGDSIKLIASELGLLKQEHLSVGELLSQLRHYSHSLLQDKKLCVVCVDNAHNLDEQSIGALLSLLQGKGDDNYGLHLILFSVPGLEKRIDALQIIDVPVYDFSMPAFSVSEMSEFLSERLQLKEVDKNKVQQVWSITKGNPGKALVLYQTKDQRLTPTSTSNSDKSRVNKMQDSAEKKSKSVIGAFNIPIGHLAAMVVLGGILIWSVIYSRSGHDSDKPNQTTKTIDISSKDTKTTEQNSLLQKEINPDANTQSMDLNDDLVLIDPSEKNDEVGKSKDDIDGRYAIDPAKPDLTDVQAPMIDVKSNIKKELEKNIQAPQQNANADEVKVSEAKVSEAKVKQTATREEVKQVVSKAMDASEDENFLLSLSPNDYTLQVMAASKLPSLKAYISRQPNRDNLYMYRGTREGKSWFVVVAHVYKTRQAALDARSSLPQEQAKAGPWPRPLSSVQQEINEFLKNH